jgi:hypothetical protein
MIRILLISLGLLLGSTWSQAEALYRQEGPSWVFSTDSDFSSTRDNLVFAIESRGLVISYISHAGAMLERTAQAVGVTTPVYQDAEILLFCKADLSHALAAANPHNITLCPYAIAVYSLTGQADQTFIAIQQPFTAEPATAPITELLMGIINEALDGF